MRLMTILRSSSWRLLIMAGEGGSVAAPIVARVMQAYFELKSIDLGTQDGGG